MNHRRYQLNYPASHVSVAESRATYGRLAPSDVPHEYSVSLREDSAAVLVDVIYPFPTEEEIVWKQMSETVRMGVGIHSKRLFHIELDISAVQKNLPRQQARAVGRRLTQALGEAFQLLQKGAEQVGPRMNYAVTSDCLRLRDDSDPSPLPAPPWMIEALANLRHPHRSDPPER